MKSKHAKGDCRNTSSGVDITREDLKCKPTCLINEDYWCNYNGTTQEEDEGEGTSEPNA